MRSGTAGSGVRGIGIVARSPAWRDDTGLQDDGGERVAERNRAYIGLGSNLGDREATLSTALRSLAESSGVAVRVLRISSLYETDPVGPPPQGPYLNAAAAIETNVEPIELLDELQRLEERAGRVREGVPRWSARTLDVDLLLYGERRLAEPRLQVPHPHLAERGFVMEPLCEIAPGVVHPTAGRTIEELAARVRDAHAVRLYGSPTWRHFARELTGEELACSEPGGDAKIPTH